MYITASKIFCYFNYFYRYCGVKDPSWAEITHFVQFLDFQLLSCERSIFCDVKIGIKELKNFIVKFMIRMSRVRNPSMKCMYKYTIAFITLHKQNMNDNIMFRTSQHHR